MTWVWWVVLPAVAPRRRCRTSVLVTDVAFCAAEMILQSFEAPCVEASMRDVGESTLWGVMVEKLITFKEQFTQNWKKSVSIYSLLMQMESQVKFCSPQNMAGASQQILVAAFSWTTKVDGNLQTRWNASIQFLLTDQCLLKKRDPWYTLFQAEKSPL